MIDANSNPNRREKVVTIPDASIRQRRKRRSSWWDMGLM